MLTDAEKTKELIEQLKEAYKEHLDLSFRIFAILFAVIGWFIASRNPLSMLCVVRPLTWIALVFVLAGGVALVFLFHLLQQRGARIYAHLQQREPDDVLYERYRVTAPMVAGGLFGQFTLLVGIFFLIYSKYVHHVAATCVPAS